jgi:Protein of unknown function (DUF3102)
MSKSNPVARIRSDAFEKAKPELAEYAEAIRALGKRVLSDVLEIGERLSKARTLIAHGDWLRWLEDEFAWSDETARRFMDVFELSKIHTVWDLDLPLGALYLLARRSTPDEVRDEMIARSASGERVTIAAVQKQIAASFVNTLATDARAVTVQTVYETYEIRAPLPNVTYEPFLVPPAPIITTANPAEAPVEGARDHLLTALREIDLHLAGWDRIDEVVAKLTPAERAEARRIVSRLMTALGLRSLN